MPRQGKNKTKMPPKRKAVSSPHFVDSDCSILHESKTSSPRKQDTESLQRSASLKSSPESEAISVVAPFTVPELGNLLARIDVLPKTEVDNTLLRVLESIITEVQLDCTDVYDMYVYFIRQLAISSTKASTNAYVALGRCLERGGMTELADSLIISLTRSLRRGFIDSLNPQDIALLVEAVPEGSSLYLLQELIHENELAVIRRAHTKPPNREMALLAMESAEHAFETIDDMLENVDRVNVQYPGCIKQVRCFLYSIFTRHLNLLETHARAIVEICQVIDHCPGEALPVILLMLQRIIKDSLKTEDAKSMYGMALSLLTSIDVEKVNSVELLETIVCLGQLYDIAPSTLKDVLPCLTNIYKRCSTCSEQRKQTVFKALLDETIHIAKKANDYEDQLELVGFFENLQKQGARLPSEVCRVLVIQAKGIALVNRVCGILLKQKEAIDDDMMANVRKRVAEWYPIKGQKSKKNSALNVLKVEQPNVYLYINSSREVGDVM